jgi:hypothetical protein
LELVLFESAQVGSPANPVSFSACFSDAMQVLPRFVVKLVRSVIPRPLLSCPGVPREIDLRYCHMLQGHPAGSAASGQLYSLLQQLPVLVSFVQAAEAASKERRRLHKKDRIAKRALCYFKKHSSILMGDQIGSGTFGKVYRAKWQGFDVAVKQLNKVDENTSTALQKEAMIMMGVSSPNIVRMFGMVDQPLGIIMVRGLPNNNSLGYVTLLNAGACSFWISS